MLARANSKDKQKKSCKDVRKRLSAFCLSYWWRSSPLKLCAARHINFLI